MLKQIAVKYFGTQTALAIVLNIQPPAVSQWGDVIPEKQALRLEKLTSGALEHDESHYQTDQTALSEAVA